jgi:tetratricopeptide (TPR) repeat protein
MIRNKLIILAFVWASGHFLLLHSARAAGNVDRVRLLRSSESGDVTDVSPTEVTLDKGSGGTRRIAVNDIRSILFDGESLELTQARLHARNGGYQTALDALRTIDLSSVQRDLVRQDVEYYQALCAAKLALAGKGEVVDAGRQLNDFVRSQPQSFHYFEAVEVIGDLLMASDKFDRAERQYAELAKAPWPDYQMRSRLLTARSLQAQGKHDEAIQRFDAVLATSDDGEAAQSEKLAATLGKAVSFAETNQLDEAVKMIEGVIQSADPEQSELQARAYNALGICYEKAGQTKDALLAFLHVDVLYSTVPDAHSEALTHLVPLWRAIGQEARARQAQQALDAR